MLERMARMRAAKARKRLDNPVEREPRMERWYRFEVGVREKGTGKAEWVELRSLRQAVGWLGAKMRESNRESA